MSENILKYQQCAVMKYIYLLKLTELLIGTAHETKLCLELWLFEFNRKDRNQEYWFGQWICVFPEIVSNCTVITKTSPEQFHSMWCCY